MKKMDILVAIGLLLFAAVVFGYNLTQREVGSFLEIAKDGEVIRIEELQKDQVIDLSYGTEWNRIEVKDGVVSMIDANCRDRLCVHTAPLKTVGRAIVCLPHRVSVVIKGNLSEPEVDGLSE